MAFYMQVDTTEITWSFSANCIVKWCSITPVHTIITACPFVGRWIVKNKIKIKNKEGWTNRSEGVHRSNSHWLKSLSGQLKYVLVPCLGGRHVISIKVPVPCPPNVLQFPLNQFLEGVKLCQTRASPPPSRQTKLISPVVFHLLHLVAGAF